MPCLIVIVMRVNKDRTDELDLSLIAKDCVIKNDRRVRFFGNKNKMKKFKFVVNVLACRV